MGREEEENMLDIVFYVLAGIVIISAIIRIVKNKKGK